MTVFRGFLGALIVLGLPLGALVQNAQESLTVYFETGCDGIAASETLTLKQAARLFREGSPNVMILSGGADTVENLKKNIQLSLRRANTVTYGPVTRGISVGRQQPTVGFHG